VRLFDHNPFASVRLGLAVAGSSAWLVTACPATIEDSYFKVSHEAASAGEHGLGAGASATGDGGTTASAGGGSLDTLGGSGGASLSGGSAGTIGPGGTGGTSGTGGASETGGTSGTGGSTGGAGGLGGMGATGGSTGGGGGLGGTSGTGGSTGGASGLGGMDGTGGSTSGGGGFSGTSGASAASGASGTAGGGAGGSTGGGGGSAGSGGGSAGSGGGTGGSESTLLIDDFSDGDLELPQVDGRQGTWETDNDDSWGGNQTLTVNSQGADGETNALCSTGSGFTDWGASIIVDFNHDGDSRESYDASDYSGIGFWIRQGGLGMGTTVEFLVADVQTHEDGGICSDCWDHFGATITATYSWTYHEFVWSELDQEGWGQQFMALRPSALYGLQFVMEPDTSFNICIDGVTFLP